MNIKLPYQTSMNDFYYYDTDRRQVNIMGYYHPKDKTYFLFAKKDGLRSKQRWSVHIEEIRRFAEKVAKVPTSKLNNRSAASITNREAQLIAQLTKLEAENTAIASRLNKIERALKVFSKEFN